MMVCKCAQWCGDINCAGLEIPAFLKLSKEERAEGWRNMPPPRAPIVFEVPPTSDPATEALRLELAAGKKAKTRARIDKLLASKETPIDRSEQRWDARSNRWVPLGYPPKPTHPEPPQEAKETRTKREKRKASR